MLRSSIPLTEENEQGMDEVIQEAQDALQELAEYLPDKDLSWKNIIKLVKPLLAELQDEDAIAANARKARSRSTNNWDDIINQK